MTNAAENNLFDVLFYKNDWDKVKSLTQEQFQDFLEDIGIDTSE